MPEKFNPHIGAAHSNWKFGRPGPRTSRQAFGHDFEPPAITADRGVFWVSVVGLAVAILLFL